MSNTPDSVVSTDVVSYPAADMAYRAFVVGFVNNGARYLDTFYPGWASRVDLANFNMRYTNADILSQIHGTDVRDSYEYKSWSFRSLVAHGFLIFDDRMADYDSLTLRWRTVIESRLNKVHK